MTAQGRFDRIQARLPELLEDLGAPAVPDYTDDLLALTAATRQRPRWTLPERWLPMGVIARDRILVPPIPWRAVGLAAILVALLAAALVIVGSQRRLPPAFGPAANGILALDRGGDIFIQETLTSPQRLVVGGPENDFGVGFTRDGTRMQFLRMVEDRPGDQGDVLAVMVAEPDGSNLRQLIGGLESPDWFDWSADGRQLVVQQVVDDFPRLSMIDVASGEIRPLATEMPAFTPNFRGPDGREIIYRGWVRDETGPSVALLAVRPDGTAGRTLTPLRKDIQSAYDYPQLSPDGRYVAFNGFDTQGRFRTHVLEVDSGDIQVLDFGPDVAFHGWASFSPDSRQLLFHAISENGQRVQVMLAPVDGSGPAVPVGPDYPVIGDSARLSQGFSPDGRLVLISEGHGQVVRVIEVATPGVGEVLPWNAEAIPSWQRLPLDD